MLMGWPAKEFSRQADRSWFRSRGYRLWQVKPRRLRIAVIGARGLHSVIGGVERHCTALYPALAAEALDLDLRVYVRKTFGAAESGADPSLSVVALSTPSNPSFETVLYSLVAVSRAVWSSDVVHFHGIGPAFFAPLARLFGAKVVMTHHAADFQRPKWGWPGRTFLRWGERLGGRFAHRVICVSEALRQDFLRRVPAAADWTVTITHGAAIVPEALPGDDRRLVTRLGLTPGRYMLTVGRLEQTKNVADLIAARAQAEACGFPLVVVGASLGDRSHEDQLRAMAGSDVVFLGKRDGVELGALYRQAAMFFHASAMEGFGLVILEALIAGAPTRLSDTPVHREFALPEDAYFPVGDRAAIARLMGQVADRRTAWPEAAAIAARYSLTDELRALSALYRSLGPDAPRYSSNTAQ